VPEVTLLWGLVVFGQIRLRRIDGYRALELVLETERAAWTVGCINRPLGGLRQTPTP